MSRDSDKKNNKKNNKKKNDKKIGKNNKTGREEIRNIPVTESAMERAFMTDIYRLLQKETLLWQLEWATISSYLAT